MCDAFSNLVFKVSRMLTKEDLDALAYLYRIPVDVIAVGSGSSGLLYLRELEGRGIFSYSNLAGLKEMLNNIQRCDLIEIVEEFERDKQKHFVGTQRCSRPQEEKVRLDMSYAQAKKTELQLTEFQKKFTAFCSKLGDLPSIPQFYSTMVKRLQQMNHECHQYITLPLCEIIQRSYLLLSHSDPVLASTSHCHDDESPVHFQRNITMTGNGSIAMRSLENSITTNGQGSNSSLPQTTQLFNRSLAASYAITHSSPHQQGINPANMDYNMLTPIQIGSEQRAHRDSACDCVNVHSKSTNSILNKKHTAHHSHSKSLKQVHSCITQIACTGPVQCNNRRTRNSKSSSVVSAPGGLQCRATITPSNPLKKASSVDNVLAISSSPSRIPKLHQLTAGRQLITHRDSCDYSGRSSCTADSYLTKSTDSGIDFYRRQQPQSSTRMWRNPGDKNYTELDRQTIAATPIYQRPQ